MDRGSDPGREAVPVEAGVVAGRLGGISMQCRGPEKR
jgi:hypothetical protein